VEFAACHRELELSHSGFETRIGSTRGRKHTVFVCTKIDDVRVSESMGLLQSVFMNINGPGKNGVEFDCGLRGVFVVRVPFQLVFFLGFERLARRCLQELHELGASILLEELKGDFGKDLVLEFELHDGGFRTARGEFATGRFFAQGAVFELGIPARRRSNQRRSLEEKRTLSQTQNGLIYRASDELGR
jgi:hypothetical protein